jgi:zinc protease
MHSSFPSGAKLAAALFLYSSIGLAAEPGVAEPWPHQNSDIAPDPAVRYGALPNGMRYIILRNATPPGQVALRMRIRAGSLQESDAQQGLAHFLEHLAFRGSANVPEGELQRMLERLGLRMGGDTNASTSQTQTVYRFDLTSNEEATIDTGLMLMREVASELTLSAEQMEKERGVVLAEERFRDSPAARSREEQAKFLLKGQFALERLPIGKVEVLRSAPIGEFVAFYQNFYRPERATLIIAGDIDPMVIERKITQRFSDWQAKGPNGADPDLGMPAARERESALFVEASAPKYISVSWVQPYRDVPDSKAERRRQLVEGLGLAVINQRMQRAATNPDAAFLGAGVSRGNMWRSARVASLSVNYDGKDWREALAAAERLRRQAVTEGVEDFELDREIAALRTRTEAAAARAATRPTPGLANGLLGALEGNEVYTSPEMDLALLTELLPSITLADVNAALGETFVGGGPLIFMSSPDPVENGEQALQDAYNEGQTGEAPSIANSNIDAWPYTWFGRPGAVVEQRDIPDIGTRFVRFANGVKLTVKPTEFRDEEVLVNVHIAGGRLTLPANRVSPIWGASTLVAGGLKDLDQLDVRRLLTTRIYSAGFGVTDDSFALSGRTRPADLVTQMQLLAAYMTLPGWREEAFERAQSGYAAQLERAGATAASVFGMQFPSRIRSGDARWMQPTAEQVRAVRLEDVKALLASALADGPIEVTMVGDITIEQAINAVSVTFGALPERKGAGVARPQPGDLRFPAPAREPVVLTHKGRADQGLALIAWPTTDAYSNLQAVADRQMLNAIFRDRVSNALRTEAGLTYSAQMGGGSSLTFPGYGSIAIYAEVPPDKGQFFLDTVQRIVTELRTAPPTADELERARKPALDGLARTMQTNGYWLDQLSQVQQDERRLDLIRFTTIRLNYVTPERVRYAAETYLDDARAWRLLVVPESQQQAAAPAPTAAAP